MPVAKLDVGRTWFTSDTHFGHRGIIEHCDRPFGSVEEMNEVLIALWNERVAPGDQVWHLGDFAWETTKDADAILDRLNGVKHLVRGNHDRRRVREAPGWASVHDLVEVQIAGHGVTLCHYPMRSWRHSHAGSLHLYGHMHGRYAPDPQSLDVGVDCWGYRPVSFPEILIRMPDKDAVEW